MTNDDAYSITLSDGRTAEVAPHADGWLLTIGGVQQSHIAAPGKPLALAYARWMLAALGSQKRRRIAQLGCNTVIASCPWFLHEPIAGRFDFDGDLNISEFLADAQSAGRRTPSAVRRPQ